MSYPTTTPYSKIDTATFTAVQWQNWLEHLLLEIGLIRTIFYCIWLMAVLEYDLLKKLHIINSTFKKKSHLVRIWDIFLYWLQVNHVVLQSNFRCQRYLEQVLQWVIFHFDYHSLVSCSILMDDNAWPTEHVQLRNICRVMLLTHFFSLKETLVLML